MAVWELALLLVAATFMMVNMVSIIVQLKMLKKLDTFSFKFMKIADKSLDVIDKAMDKTIEDLND